MCLCSVGRGTAPWRIAVQTPCRAPAGHVSGPDAASDRSRSGGHVIVMPSRNARDPSSTRDRKGTSKKITCQFVATGSSSLCCFLGVQISLCGVGGSLAPSPRHSASWSPFCWAARPLQETPWRFFWDVSRPASPANNPSASTRTRGPLVVGWTWGSAPDWRCSGHILGRVAGLEAEALRLASAPVWQV